MDDNAIIDRMLVRDESALTELGIQYGERLKGAAFQILGDRQDSEECENETYLNAWNRIPPEEPRGYLYRFLLKITRNLAIDRFRKRKAQKRDYTTTSLMEEFGDCVSEIGNPEESVAAAELSGVIARFLSEQKQEKRSMFLLRYFYCQSIEEVAKNCSCSASKAASTLYRMRKELSEELRKEGY